jgi:hypothetical protein
MRLRPLADDLAVALDPVLLCMAIGLTTLDEWQVDVLRSAHKRLVLCVGRQCGKSTIAAVLAVHQAVYTPRSLILMTAPSLRQASELFKTAANLYRQLGRVVPSEAESALSLTLENGSRIVSLPGDERTIRGYGGAALVLVDEAARVSDELMSALLPMVAVSRGKVIMMSTPWGRRGFYYEATLAPSWNTITVPATQCPRWSAEDLAEFRDTQGDFRYRQEILAEFMDASGQMFSSEDIDFAFDRESDAVPLFQRRGGLSLMAGGAA